MKEQHYSDQILREYLLGTLPAAEAEAFDELDFTDEEFAAHLQSAENNLIDAYLQNELAGETLEKFKSRYLTSPRRNKKVEIAKAFQKSVGRSLGDNQEVLEFADSKSDQEKRGFFSKLNIFAAQSPALCWGFVALALILAATGGFWLISRNPGSQNDLQAKNDLPIQTLPSAVAPQNQNSPTEKKVATVNDSATGVNESLTNANTANAQSEQTPKQAPSPKTTSEKTPPKQVPTPAAPSRAFFVLTLPLRGSNKIQNLSIPLQNTEVSMQLELEFDKYPYYKVALVSQTGEKSFWSSGKLKAKSNGQNHSLNISFPANLLKSQIYSLEVSGITPEDEAEIISNYPFRAVLK